MLRFLFPSKEECSCKCLSFFFSTMRDTDYFLKYFLLYSICFILFRIGHPDLHDHFKKHNIDMELFVSKWFVCLFMDVLPIEVCSGGTAQKDNAF